MSYRNKMAKAVCMTLFAAALAVCAGGQEAREKSADAVQEAVFIPQTGLYAGVFTDFDNNQYAVIEDKKELLVASPNPQSGLAEENVFTFLQGPKSWGEGRAWSGEWSNEYVNGNYFGNFGCGLCCMANIYSTFTDQVCSPWDMFEYARQVSGYSPNREIGAIGWADMKVTLRKCGFDTELCNKPETYEEFRQQIAGAEGAVILVSSRDDDTYWKNTGGHYVNICLYQEDTDTVFLADPADPDGNRTYLPLRYAYDALKTVSQYQYLLVHGYSEENNEWKHDGIDEVWAAP